MHEGILSKKRVATGIKVCQVLPSQRNFHLWGFSLSGNKIFIAVAGNIGTGKTTLSRMLSDRFGWQAHFESVADNPYLSDFYENMARWSYPLQIYFLNHRFKAHQAISRGSHSAIQDRSIYEDANIFARNLVESGLMERRDYENYLDLYKVMTAFLTPPDLVIYLRKSLPQLKSHIAKRGREYEQSIPDQYLMDLNRYYDEWLDNYTLGKKLIIETDGMDFQHSKSDFDDIALKIVSALDQRDLFLESRNQEPVSQAQLGLELFPAEAASLKDALSI